MGKPTRGRSRHGRPKRVSQGLREAPPPPIPHSLQPLRLVKVHRWAYRRVRPMLRHRAMDRYQQIRLGRRHTLRPVTGLVDHRRLRSPLRGRVINTSQTQ